LAVPSCAFGQTYTIQTIAGGGLPVNVPGTSAGLLSPVSVAVDRAGDLFIADYRNAILRLDAATAAGDLYIADTHNNRIRKVSDGIITTVAGDGPDTYDGSFGGDNGPAISAQLNYPQGVAVDAAGNLYIADSLNNRVREVSSGVITTIAGNGAAGYSGDEGPATGAELDYPSGVAVDAAGNLYIAEYYNHSIRKVSNGIITTIAGNGSQGFSGDGGPAANARLNSPYSVAVDAAGNVYVADTGNNRIRVLTPARGLERPRPRAPEPRRPLFPGRPH